MAVRLKTISPLRIISFFLFLGLYSFDLSAFLWRGRIPPTEQEKSLWIYGENKSTRQIAFLEFENHTKKRPQDFDHFKNAIPQSIAKKLEKISTIDLPEYDYIPTFPSRQKAYQVIKVTFDQAEKNQEKIGEIFKHGRIISLEKFYPSSNQFVFATEIDSIPNWLQSTNQEANSPSSPSNEVNEPLSAAQLIQQELEKGKVKKLPTLTNQSKTNQSNEIKDIFTSFTNRRVAYLTTNQMEKNYEFYLFKQDEKFYYDAALFAPFTNFALPIRQDASGLNYFYLNDHKNKNFKVDPNLYQLNQAPLKEIIQKTQADYIVYGSYEVIRQNTVIKLFMIHRQEKYMVHFLTKKVPSYQIKNEIQLLDVDILAYIQERPIIHNLLFTSEPNRVGSLYLNDTYYGNLPTRIKRLVSGDYGFKILTKNHIPAIVSSDLTITSNSIKIDRSDQKIKFYHQEKVEQGRIELKIKNQITSDIYLNNELKLKDELAFADRLLVGDYFLSIRKSNYITRNFMIPVKKNHITKVSFDMQPIMPDPWWNEVFFDHPRNVKIFAVLGFLFMGGSIGTFVHTTDLEDKESEVDRKIKSLDKSISDLDMDYLNGYKTQLNQDYNRYLSVALGLLGGSLISFTLMSLSHFLDIWSHQAPIETKIDHSGDVEFIFKKKF